MLYKLPKLQPEIIKTKLKIIKKGFLILNCSCLMFNGGGVPAMAQAADISGATEAATSEMPKPVEGRGRPPWLPPSLQPEPQKPEKSLNFKPSGGPAMAQAADSSGAQAAGPSEIPKPVEGRGRPPWLPPTLQPEAQTPEKSLNFHRSGGPAIAQAVDPSRIPRPVEPLPPQPLPEPQTPPKLPPPEELLQPPAGAPAP